MIVPKDHLSDAQILKKEAFAVLDASRKADPKMWVSANRIIDMCLAYQDAAKGDTENLEYSLKVQTVTMLALQSALDRIQSIAWDESGYLSMADIINVCEENHYAKFVEKYGQPSSESIKKYFESQK